MGKLRSVFKGVGGVVIVGGVIDPWLGSWKCTFRGKSLCSHLTILGIAIGKRLVLLVLYRTLRLSGVRVVDTGASNVVIGICVSRRSGFGRVAA